VVHHKLGYEALQAFKSMVQVRFGYSISSYSRALARVQKVSEQRSSDVVAAATKTKKMFNAIS